MKKLSLAVAVIVLGMCSWTVSGETNATAVVATEVRTFRLQYASAKEVAEQINQLFCVLFSLIDADLSSVPLPV